jgi:ethanolamine utilization protein EutN
LLAGRVIGVVVATRKDEKLQGRKLLVVEPIKSDGSPAGKPAIAVDLIGAGAGETVLMAKSGDAAIAAGLAPVDLAIVGIADALTAPKHTPVDLRELGFRVPSKGGR